MDDVQLLRRIAELGLELPPPPQALAAYVPVVIHGGSAWVSGQIPMVDGQVLNPGLLGAGVTVDEGANAARRGALQALSALREGLGGSLDRLELLTQLFVFVAASPDFIEHPKVANGASEMLVEILGEPGRHARAAVGVASLPMGACVEVALTAALI
jgi:enamine deaminase RidA (YjgF/YER057c/UK114 family)